MPIKKLQDIELFYEIQGHGEPVILTHGLGADSRYYLDLIRFLRPHFKLIRFDLRSSGKTRFDGSAFTLDDLSRDIIGLLDFLNINQAHIIGHSMGGMVACNFAANFTTRVKKLVLLNCRSQKNWVTSRFWEGITAVRQQHDLLPHEVSSLVIPFIYSSTFLADEVKVKNLLETVKHNPDPQSSENFWLQAQSVSNFDAISCAPHLTMPVLLVGGNQDILAPIEDMREYAKLLPNATLIEQQGGAHNPLIETPEWLAEKILSFLQDAETDKGAS